MKNSILCAVILLSTAVSVYAQSASPLFIAPEDLRLEQEGVSGFENGGGFHLYIRKKPGINSVLLTETTKDPNGIENNYAYRALEWNAVNGNERRMLDGSVLNSRYARYSLIDSTPEPDEQFGQAFHIYIPRTLTYGYDWSRQGTIEIGRWTFINIRTFVLPFGDYSAEFFDNPFMFDLRPQPKPAPQIVNLKPEKELEPPKPVAEAPKAVEAEKKEIPVLTDEYNPNAGKEFSDISDFMIYSKGPETIVEDIMKVIENINPKNNADIVFVIDATGSMKDDIEELRKELLPHLIKKLKAFSDVQLGLILYRDYGSNGYNYKSLPVKFFNFTRSTETFFENLKNFSIRGDEGGDIPEAVYEALFAAMEFYGWRANAQRKIILIGDAEPHPTPRGNKKYTKSYIKTLSNFKGISINSIILPDNKSDRGR